MPDPPLRVLIVEGDERLPARWIDRLCRDGCRLDVVRSEAEVSRALTTQSYDVAVLDVDRFPGNPLAVADLIAFRNPRTPVISVSRGASFTNGTLLTLIPNACMEVGPALKAEDLAALVDHYGRHPH